MPYAIDKDTIIPVARAIYSSRSEDDVRESPQSHQVHLSHTFADAIVSVRAGYIGIRDRAVGRCLVLRAIDTQRTHEYKL